MKHSFKIHYTAQGQLLSWKGQTFNLQGATDKELEQMAAAIVKERVSAKA